MTLRERLEAIVEALPAGASVTLPVDEILGWLEADEAGFDDEWVDEPVVDIPLPQEMFDLTVRDIAAEMGKAESTVRGIMPKVEGAYRWNGGGEWRVSRANWRKHLDRQSAARKSLGDRVQPNARRPSQRTARTRFQQSSVELVKPRVAGSGLSRNNGGLLKPYH